MDKAFCRKEHDDAARKDLLQVMETFSKVTDTDGKRVGPAFKTMKSEFVAWQEAIRAKKYVLHDENQHDQPEGAFTKRNMNRSQQSWVKTFMQDVIDEKGQVLFDWYQVHTLPFPTILTHTFTQVHWLSQHTPTETKVETKLSHQGYHTGLYVYYSEFTGEVVSESWSGEWDDVLTVLLRVPTTSSII